MIEHYINFLGRTGILKLPLALKIFCKIYYTMYPNEDMKFIAKSKGSLFVVNMKDRFIAPVIVADKFEPLETELITNLVKMNPHMNFIDIGANIGYYAVLISKLTDGKVIAYEPDEDNALMLRDNKDLNKLKNLQVHQAAVSNQNGEVILFQDKLNGGGHSMKKENLLECAGEIKVNSVRLDDHLKYLGIDKVDLIKIDVQGAEGLAFEGAWQTIKTYRPIIFMEFDPKMLNAFGTNPKDLLMKFTDLGYSIHMIDNKDKEVYYCPLIEEVINECKQRDSYVNLLLEVRNEKINQIGTGGYKQNRIL